jgi:hypothetical protein
MPMPTIPSFVVYHFFYGVEPSLCAGVYRALVNDCEKHLAWFVFEWAGVREDDVEVFLSYLLFYIFLDLL